MNLHSTNNCLNNSISTSMDNFESTPPSTNNSTTISNNQQRQQPSSSINKNIHNGPPKWARQNNKLTNNSELLELEPLTNTKRKWWSDCEELDPITLQPIKLCLHEPFVLGRNYFDPQVFATYLISTARFENPTTREPMTRSDCKRLDQHLYECRLAKLDVEDAFALLDSRNKIKGETEERRRQATLLFRQFFTYSRLAASKTSSQQQQQQQPRNKNNQLNSKSHNNNLEGNTTTTTNQFTFTNNRHAKHTSTNKFTQQQGFQIVDGDNECIDDDNHIDFSFEKEFPELFSVVTTTNNTTTTIANNITENTSEEVPEYKPSYGLKRFGPVKPRGGGININPFPRQELIKDDYQQNNESSSAAAAAPAENDEMIEPELTSSMLEELRTQELNQRLLMEKAEREARNRAQLEQDRINRLEQEKKLQARMMMNNSSNSKGSLSQRQQPHSSHRSKKKNAILTQELSSSLNKTVMMNNNDDVPTLVVVGPKKSIAAKGNRKKNPPIVTSVMTEPILNNNNVVLDDKSDHHFVLNNIRRWITMMDDKILISVLFSIIVMIVGWLYRQM
jgi:hypothetical protein